ncbi:ribonuclease H-like domain-containing protein [Tanacetum coccineum]
MACSLPHTDSEVEALVQKLINEDKGRQNAILDLTLQFENSCTAKDNLRKAYEKCTDISQEIRALIDTFLKEEKYYCRTQTNIGDVYLTAEELHQLHLDEEVLRETLEEQAMDEKAREEKIRQKQTDDNEFFLEFEKVVEDVDEDDDFNSGAWISATNYVISTGGTVTGCLGDINNFLKKKKLDQVIAIVKSCSPNYLGDLNVTMKDLSDTVRRTVHYKVLDVSSYEKNITVGAAMILANVSVFPHKTLEHYLNITKKMWLRFSVRIRFYP